MWFMIRGIFWFSLVLLLLPIFSKAPEPDLATAPKVDVGDAVSVASEALSYVGAICSEKPEVCVKGAETVEALGHRAKLGARIAYDYLDDTFADAPPASVEKDVLTGSVPDPKIPVPTRRPQP